MSNVQELEMAISQLSANELLYNQNGLRSLWPINGIKKIEADIFAGCLNVAGKHTDDEFLAGRASPL